MFDWLKKRRRKRLSHAPWPSDWDSILADNVPHVARLSPPQQEKLKSITRIIVSEKHWEAHGGLEMSDEIKVTIAATAALMLLGVENFYFDRVRTIIVFPHPIRRKTRQGMVVERESHHAGEAWQSGQVVLSWQDVVRDSRNPADGRNLVIHELAHCLDGLDGEMGGSLIFGDPAKTKRWRRVSAAEFEALGNAVRHGQPTLLDYYGATNLAEFFAVASETFFELPREFQCEHPELFELLKEYYHVNPIEWS